MKLEVDEKKPGVFVLAPTGDVDMSTSPELRNNLTPLFRKGISHVIVDLSGVSYIDSSGIATLVEGLQLSLKNKVRFTLAAASRSVQSVFDLACLGGVFEMVADVDGLLK